MKIWHSYEDVDRAVEVIKTQYQQTGTVAPELLRAYKEIMATAGKGMVAHFYERITLEMPALLKFFAGQKPCRDED
ncbi:MAG: hypothetical protein H5U02_00480 [Clostridia bacterium]|nr:hypothetical protein [Clostridia bacterium]